MDLAHKIKTAREQALMSVQEAAEKSEVSWSYWYKIEASELKNPSIAVLTRMAVAMGVDVRSLLSEPVAA